MLHLVHAVPFEVDKCEVAQNIEYSDDKLAGDGCRIFPDETSTRGGFKMSLVLTGTPFDQDVVVLSKFLTFGKQRR